MSEDKEIITEEIIVEPVETDNSFFSGQSGWMSMVPIVLIFFVMYFFIIRPQDKKRLQHDDLLKSLKKGDNIVTIGGIHGIITKIDDSDGSVNIDIAQETNVKILRSAVANLVNVKNDLKVSKNKK